MVKVTVRYRHAEQRANGEEGKAVTKYVPTVEDFALNEDSPKYLKRIFDATIQEDLENGFENTETYDIYLNLLANEDTPEELKLKVISVLEEHFEPILLSVCQKDEEEYYRILDSLRWVSEVDSSEEVRKRTAKLFDLL